MRIDRHFVCHDLVHIHRRLFLCRECGGVCTPNKYVRLDSLPHYQIATAYGCDKCDINFVTYAKGVGLCVLKDV